MEGDIQYVLELTIDGLGCVGCEETVVETLEAVSGVDSASADHEAGTATVSGEANLEALTTAVEESGYEVVN